MNILIAEDDENDVLLLRRALDRIDRVKSVSVVTNGRELINYLGGDGICADRSRYPFPDLILLDIKMPVMDGLEALHWIRKNSNAKRVPVVVLTSSTEQAHKTDAYANGANSYLLKSPLIHMAETLAGVLRYWIMENRSPEPDRD